MYLMNKSGQVSRLFMTLSRKRNALGIPSLLTLKAVSLGQVIYRMNRN